jgi:hypothetical protein
MSEIVASDRLCGRGIYGRAGAGSGGGKLFPDRARPDSKSHGMSGARSFNMTIALHDSCSQDFDDSHFFQRLTLIDICCGPPMRIADCQLPIAG